MQQLHDDLTELLVLSNNIVQARQLIAGYINDNYVLAEEEPPKPEWRPVAWEACLKKGGEWLVISVGAGVVHFTSEHHAFKQTMAEFLKFAEPWPEGRPIAEWMPVGTYVHNHG